MTRALCLAAMFTCFACGFGNDVEQDGTYALGPGADVTDSAPYPLETLLIVEEDVGLGQTRIYLFTGELRRADLGLQDLRRIARGHGGFQMAFDPPREPAELDDIRSRARPLIARAGAEELSLLRLDDEGLRASGASRYLTTITSAEYSVAAYFIALDEAPERIEIERRHVDFALDLPDPALAATREDETLGLRYEASGDYITIELGQLIRGRGEDGSEIDALVRTSLAPDAEYSLGRPLLTDVAGQGCWSDERTLTARLSQIARRYEQRRDGDWAAIHLRTDAIEIGADSWSELLQKSRPSAYCSDFE